MACNKFIGPIGNACVHFVLTNYYELVMCAWLSMPLWRIRWKWARQIHFKYISVERSLTTSNLLCALVFSPSHRNQLIILVICGNHQGIRNAKRKEYSFHRMYPMEIFACLHSFARGYNRIAVKPLISPSRSWILALRFKIQTNYYSFSTKLCWKSVVFFFVLPQIRCFLIELRVCTSSHTCCMFSERHSLLKPLIKMMMCSVRWCVCDPFVAICNFQTFPLPTAVDAEKSTPDIMYQHLLYEHFLYAKLFSFYSRPWRFPLGICIKCYQTATHVAAWNEGLHS